MAPINKNNKKIKKLQELKPYVGENSTVINEAQVTVTGGFLEDGRPFAAMARVDLFGKRVALNRVVSRAYPHYAKLLERGSAKVMERPDGCRLIWDFHFCDDPLDNQFRAKQLLDFITTYLGLHQPDEGKQRA